MYPKNPYVTRTKRVAMGNRKLRRQQLTAKARARKAATAGYTRTGGYYGRYNNSPGDETKFFDTAIGILFDTTGTVDVPSLNLIPQGVTQSQRIGRKCNITSIDLNGEVTWQVDMTGTAYANSDVKLCLILDTQSNGAAPAYGDVFDLTLANPIYAFRNMANSERFKVLKTWHKKGQHGVNSLSANEVPPTDSALLISAPPQRVSFHKTCNIPLEFSSTTGAITELKTNNLCMIAISGNGDDIHTFTGTCRLKFKG